MHTVSSTETDGRQSSDVGSVVGCDDAHDESKSDFEPQGALDIDNEEENGNVGVG